MALAHALEQAGFESKKVKTSAEVAIEKQAEEVAIRHIDLSCEAEVPEIGPEAFAEIANEAKTGCPVSKALSAVNIQLEASLTS